MKKVYVNAQWLSARTGLCDSACFYRGSRNGCHEKWDQGFDVLYRQMQSAYERLREDAPDKVFILGGGCDADVPVIVYLSEKYQSDLTIIWLDAHGDLNTPGESASSLFYGVPLRSIMDEQCFGLLRNRRPLSISQIETGIHKPSE